MRLKLSALLCMLTLAGTAWAAGTSKTRKKARRKSGNITKEIVNTWGSMSIEMYHKWARCKSGKTTKELVNGYDKLICLAHRILADKMLEKYRNTTIDRLRGELAAATQGPQAIKPAQADEDWGI